MLIFVCRFASLHNFDNSVYFFAGALMLFGFLYCPNYTRLGGFVGKHGMK